MKPLQTLALLCLVCNTHLFAQEAISIKHGCNFAEEESETEYYAFEPSDEASNIVRSILQAAGGLNFNSFILKESNVKNAVATVENGKRFILYNTVFLEQFKGDAKTKWAAYTVLAHEIGHHLNNHNFGEKDPKKRKSMELEADKFAGGVCRTLGATLSETTAGIESMNLPGETATHPVKGARVAAVANGWQKQNDLLRSTGGNNASPASTPEKQTEPVVEKPLDPRAKFLGTFEGKVNVKDSGGATAETIGEFTIDVNPKNPNGLLISAGNVMYDVEAVLAGGNNFAVFHNEAGILEWRGSGTVFEKQLKLTIEQKYPSSGTGITYVFDGQWKEPVAIKRTTSGDGSKKVAKEKTPASQKKGEAVSKSAKPDSKN